MGINDSGLQVILSKLVTRGEGSVKSGTSPASSYGLTKSPITNNLY
jgi:hypothetical protein